MLDVGDKAQIVNNYTNHAFKLGEVVTFEGMSLLEGDNEDGFNFKNSEFLGQILVRKDFEWLPNDNVIEAPEDWFFREKSLLSNKTTDLLNQMVELKERFMDIGFTEEQSIDIMFKLLVDNI